MAAITAQLVKELREKSGAGMMECKKALEESTGDMDLAIEYLRKKGLQAAAKKASRVATDGIISTYLSADEKTAVLVEVNSETDFVAKNEDFIRFSSDLAKLTATSKPSGVDELVQLSLNGKTVELLLNELVARIGEKITVRRFSLLTANANEKVGIYLHTGSKIGVSIKLSGSPVDASLIKDIAMHVAAVNPRFLTENDISSDVVEKEKEIFRVQLATEGKPADMIEKILVGKVKKFAQDNCLVDQIFVKDPTGKKKVSQVLKELDPSLQIISFTRYQVGEGMEKKEDNFADEVAKMAN